MVFIYYNHFQLIYKRRDNFSIIFKPLVLAYYARQKLSQNFHYVRVIYLVVYKKVKTDS